MTAPYRSEATNNNCAYRLQSAGRQIVVCKDIAVIASQCAHWRGNPPDEWNQVAITTKNRNVSLAEGQLSIHFPSNRGIATTSVRYSLAMTENFGAKR